MLKVVWENRRALPYAWRILRKGVCDGCALGVAGLHDWTIDGVHLCMTRLEPAAAEHDGGARPRPAGATSRRSASGVGRGAARPRPPAYPMVPPGAASRASRASRGTRRSTWRRRGSALARRRRAFGLYLTARGITNEVYYVAPEGGALPRLQQRRQRRAPLPLALDGGAEDDGRRRRDDVSLHRPDGDRPGRVLRLRLGQRPAGGHEVPLPGAQARARRWWWSTRTASPAWSATGCRRTPRAPCSAPR